MSWFTILRVKIAYLILPKNFPSVCIVQDGEDPNGEWRFFGLAAVRPYHKLFRSVGISDWDFADLHTVEETGKGIVPI